MSENLKPIPVRKEILQWGLYLRVFFFLLQGMLRVKWIVHTLATMHNIFSSRVVHLNIKRSKLKPLHGYFQCYLESLQIQAVPGSLKVSPQWGCQHGEKIQNICLSKSNQVVLRDKTDHLFLASSCLILECSFMDTERRRRLHWQIRMIKKQTFQLLFLRSALHCQQLQIRHKEQRTYKMLKRGN